MKCYDCNQEIIGKTIKLTRHVGGLTDNCLLCQDCAEKFNSYKNHDGKVFSFCMKCCGKFLTEELVEVTIKKEKLMVCQYCKDEGR